MDQITLVVEVLPIFIAMCLRGGALLIAPLMIASCERSIVRPWCAREAGLLHLWLAFAGARAACRYARSQSGGRAFGSSRCATALCPVAVFGALRVVVFATVRAAARAVATVVAAAATAAAAAAAARAGPGGSGLRGVAAGSRWLGHDGLGVTRFAVLLGVVAR